MKKYKFFQVGFVLSLLAAVLVSVSSCTSQQEPRPQPGHHPGMQLKPRPHVPPGHPVENIQIPKREFRGAWIQTVFQDEYAQMTPVEMQRDFIRKADFSRRTRISFS